MILDKREKQEVDLTKQIEIVFQILNYNQGLVQFADNKANALLLINSIFIASLGPFFSQLSLHERPLLLLLMFGFLATSVVSIVIALAVIMTRGTTTTHASTNGALIYCRDIAAIPSPEGFITEFNFTEAKKFRDATLMNAYTVAKIASSKFGTYNWGQLTTVISCILWMFSMAMLLLQ